MPVARLIPQPVVEKCQVVLSGLKDGANLIYTTPDYFIETSIKLERNGLRQMRNGGSCDYAVSESGGAGTGFDTITLLDRALFADELIFADYRVAS